MRRLAAVIIAAGGTAFALFASCSAPDAAAPRADAAPDSAADVSWKDVNVESAETGPTFNAEGWVRLDYPNCNLYAAPSADKMPTPLVWESCPSIVAPLGLACRQIRHSWAAPTSGGTVDIGVVDGRVDPNGKAWLALGYSAGGYAVKTVSEADGPVHQAVSYIRGQCSVTTASLANSKSTWMIVRPKSQTSAEENGAIGGDVDGVPLTLEHWADGAARSYYAGPVSYFALGPDNAVRSWVPAAPALGNIVLNDPGQLLPRTFVGEDFFYDVGDESYGRIKVYSPAKGARDLISFGNVISKNAVSFGTDGVDMVWIEASGRAAVSDPWTTIDIMTAKYTTDASAIQKRRLRSEGAAAGVQRFTVGCGYAAQYLSTPGDGNIVRIVRISDGRSWKLSEISGDGGLWLFQVPYAITCEEIFLSVRSAGRSNVARVRLDSLGAGELAD
jgi:hypothetical protein